MRQANEVLRKRLSPWKFVAGLLLIGSVVGCGPETKDVVENVPQSPIDEDGLADVERDVDDAVRAEDSISPDKAISADIASATESSTEPATVIDFSTWEGNDVEWQIVEGKEKELYADNDLTNQTAPTLFVQQWLSDVPELTGDKFLLVDFWATWCPPCRATIPELNEIAHQFADQLIVVGLSDEPAEEVQAMEKPTIEYYSGIDPESRTKSVIGVQGIPHVMLIDPSGKVAWQGFPKGQADPLTAERIAEIIDQYHQSK